MGLELELLSATKLPPIRTTVAATTASLDAGDNAVLDGCSTPTLAATVLAPPLVCPPAPRKPKPPAAAKIRKLQRRGRPCGGSAALRPTPNRWFIAVRQDVLAAVFVARPAATAPPASKKIRVHVVG